MNKKIIIIGAIIFVLAISAAAFFWKKSVERIEPKVANPQRESEITGGTENNTGIANPASVNCEQKGGGVEIRTVADGGQTGLCIFSDKSECEEWAFMRGECKQGDSIKKESGGGTVQKPPVVQETLSATDKFAKCLADSGAKFYGASWCSHCTNQKKLFGESIKYVPYVECATDTGQTPVCQQAGIQAYPTWIFQNGEKVTGELTFEKLSEYSGCKLD